jgi:hypothetical protein
MILNVIRITFSGFDEDDEKLSEARMTPIKRKWIIDVEDVLCFGEYKLKPQYLELWFVNGDSMFIQHDMDEFTKIFEFSRYELRDDDDGEEIPPEFPKKFKIIEVPNIGKTTNPPDENTK